jgi:hypothetical protein
LAIAKLPFAIQLDMVKIAQTPSARRWMMDPAVGRRNEEETDLRVRICDSTETISGANRTSQIAASLSSG